MGLIDPSSPDYGGKMTAEERRREALINAGLQSINAVYGGGTAPQYSLITDPKTKYDPTKTYYTIQHGAFKPYVPQGATHGPSGSTIVQSGLPGGLGAMGFIGLFDDHRQSPQDIFRGMIRGKNVFQGTPETYKGFGPDFFEGRKNAYVNYEMPILSDQFSNAQDSIMYGLANRGILGGSASSKAARDLNQQQTYAVQGVQDEGFNQAAALRDQVEASYQNAINQLYQSANPAGGTQAAIANVARFQANQPSTFAPIANAFSNLLSQYATSRIFNPGVSPSYILPDQTDYNAAGALPKN